MKRRVIALAAAAGLAAGAASAANWRAHSLDLYGLSFEAPANWKLDKNTASENGVDLSSPDNLAGVKAYGQQIENGSAAEVLKTIGTGDEAEHVVSRRQDNQGADVVGYTGDTMYRWRGVISCGGTVFTTVQVIFPRSQKARYDAIVSHIADSVTVGRPGGEIDCPD